MADNKTPEKKEEQVSKGSESSDLDVLKDRVDTQQRKLESMWNLVTDKKKVEQIVDENYNLKKLVTEKDRQIGTLEADLSENIAEVKVLKAAEEEHQKKAEQVVAENINFKKLVTEKDSLVAVLKEKLTQKATLLKQLEDNSRETAQDIDNYKKQVFSLQNKIGAVEKRVFSTDEQNQKILYEFMKSKERLKQLETDLAERDRIISKMKEAHIKNTESFQMDAAEKKMLLMKNHSKKITVMNAALDMLKTKIDRQNKLLENQSTRERKLIDEFNRKMQELLTAKDNIKIDTSEIHATPTEEGSAEAEESSEELSPVTEDLVTGTAPEALASAEVKSEQESRASEIVPIIELAMDHGDGLDSIKHSILSSGYSEADFEEALSGMNIVREEIQE